MRLLFVVDQLENGGLERQLSYLISELSKLESIQVSCFVWNHYETAYYYEFFKEHLADNLWGESPDTSFKTKLLSLRRLIKKEKPKHVISFSNFTNFQVFLASSLTKSKPIGAIRSSAEYMLAEMGPKKALSLLFPQCFIVNSNKAIQGLKRTWWLKHKTYHYFPNYIDRRLFQRSSATIEFDSISVGSLLPEKRMDRLVELIETTRKIRPTIRHIHIGGGALLPEFRETVKTKDLGKQLIFHGPDRDIPRYLSKANIFLHFSDYEGTPNAVLEAMAVGLPIISTDCGDVDQYVKPGVSGYIIGRTSAYQADAFHDKYHIMLEDVEQQRKMGEVAFKHMRRFDSTQIAQDFIHLLEKSN